MLIQADARHLPLRDGCVQCCITSPPYYGLRDYGVAAQLGMEPQPYLYVEAMVQVFREVRRVLKDDGVLWCNIGDSYAASGRGGNPPDSPHFKQATNRGSVLVAGLHEAVRQAGAIRRDWCKAPDGYKQKDLIGIPWMLAFALRADGWYLRSDIIWSKPNPMPESVTDRPTKAHEYLFLLTKSERYWYDADAIAETLSDVSLNRYERAVRNEETYDPERHKHGDSLMHNAPMEVLTRAARHVVEKGTRNKRSVWTVPTMPYAGAHFATMPEKLVEPCILAGSRFGDLVFDPFSGSGTVLAVAERLGRRGVGTDLNPAYHQLAKARTAQRGLRFEDAERHPTVTEAGNVDAVRLSVE